MPECQPIKALHDLLAVLDNGAVSKTVQQPAHLITPPTSSKPTHQERIKEAKQPVEQQIREKHSQHIESATIDTTHTFETQNRPEDEFTLEDLEIVESWESPLLKTGPLPSAIWSAVKACKDVKKGFAEPKNTLRCTAVRGLGFAMASIFIIAHLLILPAITAAVWAFFKINWLISLLIIFATFFVVFIVYALAAFVVAFIDMLRVYSIIEQYMKNRSFGRR